MSEESERPEPVRTTERLHGLRARLMLAIPFEEPWQQCLNKIYAIDPDDDETRSIEASNLALVGKHVEAEKVLDRREPALELRAHFLQARADVAEARGQWELADELFARAAALDEDLEGPIRVAPERVSERLENVLASLPEAIRKTLENVIIEVLEGPADEGREKGGATLGFYLGPSIHEPEYDSWPSRITLFKRPAERFGPSEEDILEDLEVTLLHEIGHHLGLEHDDMEGLGLL